MPLNPANENPGSRLLEKLQRAQTLTHDLMSEIIAAACPRLALLPSSGKAAARIAQLFACSAWAEVGLALIEIELPGWSLRRLAYDDGEWHCSLSRQPNLPVEIDDTADSHHEALPLAILSAFLEAQDSRFARKTASAAVPQVRSAPAHTVCCDNFA